MQFYQLVSGRAVPFFKTYTSLWLPEELRSQFLPCLLVFPVSEERPAKSYVLHFFYR